MDGGSESRELDPRDLRVSDAEREHVGTLLQRAVGQGLLTVSEFTERMDTAMAARTRGELNAVLADLPGMSLQGPPPAVTSAAATSPAVPGAAPVELRNTASNLRRNGPWVVPPALRLRNRFGNTVLDFTSADVRHPVVDIEVDDVAASTTLLVPEGATVDTDHLQHPFSNVHNEVGTGPPTGTPHLVLRGTVRAGAIIVRRPHRHRFRHWFGH